MQTAAADVAIIGAGAAGLAAAIFTARRNPALHVIALDGAKKLGAKILVSGGGRCNVTNRLVTPEDFYGGSRHGIRRVLGALPVAQTIEFFREIGVELYEDYDGKLFPTTNRASTVLDALLAEARRRGVVLASDHRVHQLQRTDSQFHIITGRGPLTAHTVVLATGGLSLPKTGSDGAGYGFAGQLGHTIVPTTPALVPLVLEGDFHKSLSGIAHDVELAVRCGADRPVKLRRAMLWTHFGVSGPGAMDASRWWHRARLDGLPAVVTANLLPGESFESLEGRILDLAAKQPRARLGSAMAALLPARLAAAVPEQLRIAPRVVMSHLSREDRRRLINALLAWPLPVSDSRGYAHAEVTAGGVPLDEVDPRTMASRRCPGVFLVGEILDCDGRIGGFNFQWAWATGFVAGQAIGAGGARWGNAARA